MELKDIKGIGVKSLEYLHQEGIYTIKDLLLTFPKGYSIYEMDNEHVLSGNAVCFSAVVESNPVFLKYRRNVNAIIFYVISLERKLKCIMFSSDYMRYKLFKGSEIILYGKYKAEAKEFVVQNIFFEPFVIRIDVDYKLKNVSNALMTRAVKNALQSGVILEELLPPELIEKYRLYPYMQYVAASHFPISKTDYVQIHRRRKYEEFFWYSVSLELLKTTRKKGKKLERVIHKELIDTFIQSLGFPLTEDQNKAIDVICSDILTDYPMNRLIQGDVGCGKSIIAYVSALLLVTAGYQAVLMVPTELLAIQQYENMKKYFSHLNLTIELLTSSVKTKEKNDILYRLMNNRVQIVVGTHALIEDNVSFYKLGIVIIDEQHRFGVAQRGKLIEKYPGVDCLYLTATPIPRTLGLTSFGDLDITSIHSMPSNRKTVQTFVCDYNEMPNICRILLEHIQKNEQAYIVVPLVEKTEDGDAMDIREAYRYFSKELPQVKIGVVHGKMDSDAKTMAMQDFKNGKYQVLISTTVIEVGVDVKNATVMVIMDANRYGLAQIHQLRGRVGRGDKESFCYLISKVNNERLEILKNTTDGFEISVEDLKLRGPGDYLGDQQSGFTGLNYADFQNDFKIWRCAKEDGEIYCHKFLQNHSKNPKFLEILSINKKQKTKIN